MGRKSDQKHRKIIEIEALQKQIVSHARDINRPFSIAISMLTVPPILMLLLLDPRSPFYSAYQSYYGDQFQECRKLSDNTFDSYNILKDSFDQAMQHFDEMLTKIYQMMRLFSTKELSHEDALDMLDTYRDRAFTDNDVNQLKTLLITLINTNMRLFTNRQIPINTKVLPFLNLKDLYHLADKARRALEKDLPQFITFGKKFLTDLCIKANYYQFNIVPQILLTFLVQRFVVDQALTRFFPNGLGLYARHLVPIKNPSDLSFLSPAERDALIVTFQARHDLLAKKARRNVLISRALLPILFGLCIAYSGTPVSARLWILLVCTLSAAMTGAWHEASTLYERISYQQKTALSLKLADELFKGYSKSVTLIDYDTLETSQIEIEFTNVHGVSPKQVRQNVINVLVSHEITVNQATQKYIVLPASLQLSKNKILKIRENIKAALDRHEALTELQNQLQNLSKQPNIRIEMLSSLENSFLMMLVISIKAPKECSDELCDTFKHLTPTVTHIDNNTVISMQGYQQAHSEKIKKLINTLGVFTANQKQDYIHDEQYGEKKQRSKNKRESSSSSSSVAVPEKEDEPVTKIKFPSGQYRSDDDECPIKLIENTRNYQYPHYTLFRVPKKDVSSDETHDKLRKIVTENPRFVSPDASQGIVIVNHYVRNSGDKSWELRSAKTKPVGSKHGAWRAFAHSEIAPTGETLHIFDRAKKMH